MPLTALVVLDWFVEAELPGRAREMAGDDVPPDSAVCEVVEGGVTTGKGVGRLVGGRAGYSKGEVCGLTGHRADEQHRVKLGTLEPRDEARITLPLVHIVEAVRVGDCKAGPEGDRVRLGLG